MHDTTSSADAGPSLIIIPSGPFLMGSTDAQAQQAIAGGLGDDYLAREIPQHTVEVASFSIARYPVTNRDFAAFVAATGYRTVAEVRGNANAHQGGKWQVVAGTDWQHPRGPDTNITGQEDHPVVQMAWDDAVAYCKWLAEATAKPFRLPTEAEWEKAARGPEGRIWPWGDKYDPACLNNADLGPGTTTPVTAHSPAGDSPYGVADMCGNTWEWASSLFRPYPYRPGDGREDPASREMRAMRGGSHPFGRWWTRCAFRLYDAPTHSGYLGFRVALSD